MINKLALANTTPLGPQTPTEENKKPSFGRLNNIATSDQFCCSQEQPKKKLSKLDVALMAIMGTIVASAGIAKGKLGNAIKLLGEEAPKSLFGRIKKLAELASKDGMTGLFNKKALLANLSQEHKIATKAGKDLSVGMLDMDNFKGINEVFSHDTGDIVLKRISANIQDVADKYGLKGFRYGGEEFVVALPEHDAQSAHKIINEMAEAIKSDKTIQGYLPEFMKKAQDDLSFYEPRMNQLTDIFKKLRTNKNTGSEIESLATTNKEIAKFVEEHIKKCKPSDTKNLDEIIAILKKEPPAKADLNIKIGKDSSIGKELDKIFTQYQGQTNDLKKWTEHLKGTNVFTVSGGVVNLKDAKGLENGTDLVKLADAALKGAKENGKNQIIIANDEIIKETLAKINQK